jgi:hypothetical protein
MKLFGALDRRTAIVFKRRARTFAIGLIAWEPCCALAAGVIRLIADRRFIVNKPVYLRGCGVARLTASC